MSEGCTAAEPFALRVLGNDMLPEFKHGQIIIVDPAYPPCHGAYVVVNYRGEYLFGQLLKEDNRQWLHYLNSDQAPLELQGPFECKGVVIQRAGRRRDIKHYDYSD
jgi:phage repressor protein C with HTH and peptisase S24 domain